MTTTLDFRNIALPMLYLTSWIKAGNQCGINALQPFYAMGLNMDLSSGHQVKIPPLQLLQALDECTQASAGSHFPFHLGHVFNFDHVPMVGTFLATSPTIRSSLRLRNWALPLVDPWMRIELHEHDEEAWLTFEQACTGGGQAPLLHVTEAAMAAVHRLVLGQLGDGLALLAVHFTHGQPAYHRQCAQHFRIEPKYGQTRNALFFRRRHLDQPLPGAAPQVHEQAFLALMAQVPSLEKVTTFSQCVIDRLVTQPPLLTGGLTQVAKAFDMRERTLQRRLRHEGQGFMEVLNQAQQILATRWLADGNVDVLEVSTRLGYKSRRAFSNAFKKWTGVSPSEYRDRPGK